MFFNRSKSRCSFVLESVIYLMLAFLVVWIGIPLFRNLLDRRSESEGFERGRLCLMALKTYAIEHGGAFPPGHNASEVFSALLPSVHASGYISTKEMFFATGSAYTPRQFERHIDEKPLFAVGENHWAFMAGVSLDGDPNCPILFDGPASSDGKYSSNRSEKGGLRAGKTAMVFRLSGVAEVEKLTNLYIKTEAHENLLMPSASWIPQGKLLMPY